MKLLEENIEVDLCDLRLGSGFFDTTKAQVTKKERETNGSSSKLKTSLLRKGHILYNFTHMRYLV